MTMAHPLVEGPFPLYEQIKQRLRGEIARGTYQPGDKLPSEQELLQRFGVSRITVRQAISDLERDGLVTRRHGKGTFVTATRITQDLVRLTDFVEDMEQAGLTPSSRVLAHATAPAEPSVRAALHLAEGALAYRIERLRLAEDQPIALDITWLPDHYGRLLDQADLAHETIFRFLETRHHLSIDQGIFTFSATNATPEQAQHLGLAPGTALFCIERLALVAGGEPLYLQYRWYRPDRVRYQIVLQRGTGTRSGPTVRALRPVFPGEEAGV
jgi:GntR family transcriptional regulator